uniref:AB hydrolase-1 domain-containing protein n=1 Tax=Alexandrium andersonii TaxID=327968 RepID=A0A7S2DIX4_9DINO|mmetsp:Transcript_54444/g.122831  ORF Transcript_54444/g.122831 Transcript_54444/m.122831 type:complete len:343 (+) Transcript_54444:46-1074(+)
MSGQIWEVVGGSSSGGIVAKEGKVLKSKELPDRLRTGSLIRQVELVGDRLSYERLSGAGPPKGWVSLKFKSTDLVVQTDKEPPPAPVLACFYSGGMTGPQGRNQLKALFQVMEGAGITDRIVLDHIGEKGFEGCKDFDEYTSRLVAAVDEKFQGRPVFIIAHSHGTVPAWGLAKKLGGRCLKVYVLTRRPPDGALLDETWGVDSAAKVADLDEEFLVDKMVEAWPNEFLESQIKKRPLNEMVMGVMAVVKRQYSSPVYPTGSADVATIVGEDKAIVAPLMALAAEKEAEPKGETAKKMEGWSDFTAGGFDLVTVPGVDHMGIMSAGSPAFGTILNDMRGLMP